MRLAITAGTVQPKPISIGTMLRPERPMRRRSMSITKATRAMYPLSSKKERKKKSTTMVGTKLTTLPTPLKMPSITSEWIESLTLRAASIVSALSVSHPMPASSASVSHAPTTLNVSQNTSAMIAANIGTAVYLPVRIRSIF